MARKRPDWEAANRKEKTLRDKPFLGAQEDERPHRTELTIQNTCRKCGRRIEPGEPRRTVHTGYHDQFEHVDC